MFRNLLVTSALVAVVGAAGADITANMVPYSEGVLDDGVTEYSCWHLQVTIPYYDAWTFAGGPEPGEPWCTVTGGTFFQYLMNDSNPPSPIYITGMPDSEFTSFYTTHLLWPNTSSWLPETDFAYGPADTPTALNADWYYTPDGSFYPGTFTIAQVTVLPDGPDWCAEVDVVVGSMNVGPVAFSVQFGPGSSCCLGDLDGDVDVDLTDLAQLLGNYGTTGGATYWEGDLDGDDDVDLTDLAEMLAQYGTGC